MTRVLHTARISNVDSGLFLNKIRMMVSFTLDEETEKNVFSFLLSRAWNKEKRYWCISFTLHKVNTFSVVEGVTEREQHKEG